MCDSIWETIETDLQNLLTFEFQSLLNLKLTLLIDYVATKLNTAELNWHQMATKMSAVRLGIICINKWRAWLGENWSFATNTDKESNPPRLWNNRAISTCPRDLQLQQHMQINQKNQIAQSAEDPRQETECQLTGFKGCLWQVPMHRP